MITGNRTSRLRPSRALALIALGLSLAASGPASADPTLFTGVGTQSGGIIGYTYLVTTITGPTNVASNTASGGFALPAYAFSLNTDYTAYLNPTYPYARVIREVKNVAGTFVNGYWSPSVPVTVNIPNVTFPYATQTPRNAFVRLLPGANGLGAKMTMQRKQTYFFDIVTSLGVLKAVAGDPAATGMGGQPRTAPWGGGDHLTAPRSFMMWTGEYRCCITYPEGYPSILYSASAAEAIGPWATGMLTVYAGGGANATTTTQTGVDSRTAFDSGVVSLVTPRILFSYNADGTNTGTIVDQRDDFAVVHGLTINFVPEPGQFALLASGLLGLLALQHVRRGGR